MRLVIRSLFLVFIICLSFLGKGQTFCERALTGPNYHSISPALSINEKVYHFFGYAKNGFKNRKNFLLKVDECWNILDSVRVPLDSGDFSHVPHALGARNKIYGLTYTTNSDPVPFDTVASHFKQELLIYDTTLTLEKRIDLTPTLGEYNYMTRIFLFQDSLLLVTGSNRRGVIGTYFGFYDLSGSLLDSAVVNGFNLYNQPVGKFAGANKNFISFGGYAFNFEVFPFRLTTVDTLTTFIQNYRQELMEVKKLLPHPNGNTYLVGLCDDITKSPRAEVVVYQFDPNGNQLNDVVFGVPSGYDRLGFDASIITSNGDLIVASSGEVTTTSGTTENLFIRRFSENLSLKWVKEISIPGISFVPVTVQKTSDNGILVLSVITDPANMGSGYVYNDLHILHIDSTGYYSPLSGDDFQVMMEEAPSVYPNPVQTSFTIDNLDARQTYQAGIYGVGGGLKQRLKIQFPFRVDVDHLQPGIYLITLQDETGISSYRKFIVE